MKLMKVAAVVMILFLIANVFLTLRFYQGKKAILVNNKKLAEVKLQLPEVNQLKITPIVDNRTIDDQLKTEDGVSYLVETDRERILFDVGWNKKSETVSPMVFNMQKMGISPGSLTSLVVSHCHPDHVGGIGFKDKKIVTGMADLHAPIYTPINMTSNSGQTTTVAVPSMIGPEVGSTGPLAEQMYYVGTTFEQALMVNVKGKGLVLISGCGHPQINAMVANAQANTGLPVYAFVGGTHLYYTKVESGFWRAVMGSTRLFARGNTKADVENVVDMLKQQGVEKVYISGHDADQSSLEIFESRYGSSYDVIQVGKVINF